MSDDEQSKHQLTTMEVSFDYNLNTQTGDYLLKADRWFDCYFFVGEKQERIGAIRANLVSQSRTWWNMLSPDSPLVEKGDITVPDIEPDIFRLLLKYVYGDLEDFSSLSEDTVVKLCYCANKYFMMRLMKRISARLQPSSVDEVFSALHCMMYYNLCDVEKSVKKIVQTKTKMILAHPDFLRCDVDSITYIVKQDKLNCYELDVWKAALSWAKSRAQSDVGSELRRWLLGPLQHIRLLTLPITDLHNVVFVTDVLNSNEMVGICKRDIKDIETLCNKTENRGCTNTNIVVQIKRNVLASNAHFLKTNTSCSCIITKEATIKLQSITCKGHIRDDCMSYKEYFFGYPLAVNITVTLTRITNHIANTSDEVPIVIRHDNLKHFHGELFTIPTIVGDKGVVLLANSKYKIDLVFTDVTPNSGHSNVPSWSSPDCVQGHDFEHGKFHCSLTYINGTGQTSCPIRQFTYSVAMED